MKKEVYLRVIIIALVLLSCYESYEYFCDLRVSNKVFEDVKQVEAFNDKEKALTIMIQNDDDYDYHEAPDRSKWPSYTEYTYAGTKCEDASGNNIENTRQYVQFDELSNMATITTKKTIYCTLYFSKGRPAAEVLPKNAVGGNGVTVFTENDVDGLYRFAGTYTEVNNNFLCFGAVTNLEECVSSTGNKNKYLYRIIGIVSKDDDTLGLKKGQMKIIRANYSRSGSNIWANTGDPVNLDWEQTIGTLYNVTSFYNSLDQKLKNLITTQYWYKGDIKNDPPTTQPKIRTSKQYSAGLMYASDYVNSCPTGVKTYGSKCYWYQKPIPSWLHLSHGHSNVSLGQYYRELTKTHYGSYTNSYTYMVEYHHWEISADSDYDDGQLVFNDDRNCDVGTYIRPVFYLDASVPIAGFGTEQSPYIITSIAGPQG